MRRTVLKLRPSRYTLVESRLDGVSPRQGRQQRALAPGPVRLHLFASGFDLRESPAAASRVLDAFEEATGEAPGQIKNFSLTAGANDGQVDASFDPEDFAKTYEVQIATVDPVAGPWVTKATPTASNCSIPGLTSGQRVWGRARAIGTNGPGPWSDPATKIVP